MRPLEGRIINLLQLITGSEVLADSPGTDALPATDAKIGIGIGAIVAVFKPYNCVVKIDFMSVIDSEISLYMQTAANLFC